MHGLNTPFTRNGDLSVAQVRLCLFLGMRPALPTLALPAWSLFVTLSPMHLDGWMDGWDGLQGSGQKEPSLPPSPGTSVNVIGYPPATVQGP